MDKKKAHLSNFYTKQLVVTALFTALCAVSTYVIVIPLPYGYFNAGDIFVLLAGWCLGPLYGSLASAVGSSLADIFSGYPIYAPATFLIKGAVTVVAYFICKMIKHWITKEKRDYIPRILSAVVAEAVMVIGYFIFESILYGLSGGSLGLLGNTLQGLICVIGGALLFSIVYTVKPIRNFFPLLN